ncbi:class I SAM-dependent methyltransferase [Okeania sp. SIO1F9]|uniref:class I SAM-dependent methyltransferase n=1 Tax=Okeania sp. SIO1F9 TaxID=2607813 RepID=UPI001450BD95|nr:class I SAM-dependent methyltransferase [Okeania sp. SIO1F9]NET80054.1 class I SAM-dependent methyltransferase [Okeania sp. SIO1F9]
MKKLNMNEFIKNIYEADSVVGRSGKVHKLHSTVDREEGEFLFSIINSDSTIRKTLEVGCAYGLSSLYICSGISERPGASHTIIDPFQNTQWDGVGIKKLEEVGIDFYSLIEKKSEFALPKLLETNEGQFDFIFIDGWHTFDHTLLDCFYTTRLLRVGGILAIDDVCFPSVRRVVDFLKNYPCYEEVGVVGKKLTKSWKEVGTRFILSSIKQERWANILSKKLYGEIFEDQENRMVALRKIQEDQRNWYWHDDAF